jgi:putative aldouronate transport system permease protein
MIRRDKYLLLMLLFPIAFYVLFRYGPMYGLIMAFQNFRAADGIWGSNFVGFTQFQRFMGDPLFWRAFRNTIVLNLMTLLVCFPAPIILALMLNELKNRRFKKLVQSVSYMPYFISTVVVCSIVITFASNQGIINNVVAALGGKRINFLLEPRWFRAIYILSELWQFIGWNSIIYLAALSGADVEVYEAARIDGANRFQQLWYVTLPFLSTTIAIMLILNVGNIMDLSFEKILLLYKPSTYEVSDVISTMIYRRGIKSAEFSFTTAVGMFQSVVSMIFIVGANFLSKKLGGVGLF